MTTKPRRTPRTRAETIEVWTESGDTVRDIEMPEAPAGDDDAVFEGGDGVLFIASKRAGHEDLGYTAEHDDEHENGELAAAGAAYAIPPNRMERRPHWIKLPTGGAKQVTAPAWWPYSVEFWKPGDVSIEGRIDELATAGSFIAAEIDRLLRLQQRGTGT